MQLLKAFYWPFKWHAIVKNIWSEAWPQRTTLLSNKSLKWWPCRGPLPPQAPCVLSSALPTFLEYVIRLYRKMLFLISFGVNTTISHKKCMTIFNLNLIWTIITTSRINLFAWVIFMCGKRCNMYGVYCRNYILNEWKWNWKTQFLYSIAIQYILKQANYQMFSDSLPSIEIHNTGHAIQNKIYLSTWGKTDLKLFCAVYVRLGVANFRLRIHDATSEMIFLCR